jgi:nitroreductase
MDVESWLELKRARTDYPVHPLIQQRWSPRAFADRPVEREKIASLFEAARWAPSSYNEQPWRYLLGFRGEGDAFERLARCLVEANQRWAPKAPVLFLACTRLRFFQTGKPNRHAFHDVGLSLAHLMLQATSMGLYVHLMAGFDPSRARDEFWIPQEFEPVVMGAIGYLGDPAQLPELLREKELAVRERRRLAEILFEGAWGRPFVAPSRGASFPRETGPAFSQET